MPIKLFISGGHFDLDPRYTGEDVHNALTSTDPAEVIFELAGGGSIRTNVSRRTEWTIAAYDLTHDVDYSPAIGSEPQVEQY